MTGKPVFATEIALLVLLSTLWGASYALIKIGVATIPPLTFIAARTLIAALLLGAVLHRRGIAWPRESSVWRRFLVQACLNSVVPFTLIAWAEQTIDAGLATILNSTSPIFAFLLTAFVTHHEPVALRKLFGVAAGLLGSCLIVGVAALSGLGTTLWAQLAIVAATICYAGAAIVGKGFKGLDPMLPAAGSLISGSAILIPLSLLCDRPWTLAPSANSVLALLALAVFSTAAALVIYFRLLQTLGSVGATAQSYLRVPIGVAIGVLLLGERLSPTAWIGLACVVAGVVAMTLPANRPFLQNQGARNDRERVYCSHDQAA
jgi:drug/metabolite transporter (DMT)-like permease